MRIFFTLKHFVASICTLFCVAAIVGCYPVDHDYYSISDIDDVTLTDSGVVVSDPSGKISIEAPVGMGMEKVLRIGSTRSEKIGAMTVSTSCGCSMAMLADSDLAPRQFTTLSLYFKPEHALLRHSIGINVFIRYKGDSQNPFTIPVLYTNSDSPDYVHVKTIPQEISLNSIKTANLDLKHQITGNFDRKVNFKNVSIVSDCDFIDAQLKRGKDNQSVAVEISIHNPPVGKIEENIQIRVQKDGQVFCKDIPIVGQILAPFYCEPSSVTLNETEIGKREIVQVRLFKRDTALNFPAIEVTGSWVLKEQIQITDDQLLIDVVSMRKENENVGYGMIKIYDVNTDCKISVPMVINPPQ
ncbi:hypothetical protein FACS1894189_4370 [Planctomycetales bacterium]|nr:hypothetical protein FACS1894189_4370 [Planctomycetales bacterium]